MRKNQDLAKNVLLFALGMAIVALWIVFCFNSEIDGDLVLSRFFLGEAISVWLFLGIGFVLFLAAVGLMVGLPRYMEDERTIAFHNKKRAKKLNTCTVLIGLVFFIALLAMIVGAVGVLTSSGSDRNTPGTIYYYYYY